MIYNTCEFFVRACKILAKAVLIVSFLIVSFVSFAWAQEVNVGVLHSLSGTMAISERAVAQATMLAIDEINRQGGVLGRTLVPILEDGQSEEAIFRQKAAELIEEENVVTVFGGWTSASRQAMLPVFERTNNLLWYPVQFEGNECSPNIIYAGAQPNQQALPALEWAFEQGHQRFFLLGSDYVYPRTTNRILNAHIAERGGEVLGEEYFPLGHRDFNAVIDTLNAFEEDYLIFNTLNGDSNVAFFEQLYYTSFSRDTFLIMSFSIAEPEIQFIGANLLANKYAAWNYFQSLDIPANAAFVENYRAEYGGHTVISDPMVHGYVNVYLWKAAVEIAGTFDVDAVRRASYGLTLNDTPMGTVTIESNQSIRQMVYVGQIGSDGQFDIVWDSGEAVRPEPYDPLVFPGESCDFAVE